MKAKEMLREGCDCDIWLMAINLAEGDVINRLYFKNDESRVDFSIFVINEKLEEGFENSTWTIEYCPWCGKKL